jgi:hypothetical protein
VTSVSYEIWRNDTLLGVNEPQFYAVSLCTTGNGSWLSTVPEATFGKREVSLHQSNKNPPSCSPKNKWMNKRMNRLDRPHYNPNKATVRLPAAKPWLECGTVGDIVPCDWENTLTLVKHSMLLPILKKLFTSQWFYSASGCASSDVSVRSESASLSLLALGWGFTVRWTTKFSQCAEQQSSPSFYQHFQQV